MLQINNEYSHVLEATFTLLWALADQSGEHALGFGF
jgi:hypothetical protein